MPVEAFSSISSIVGALNGGITDIDRILLSGRGISQVQAAQSIQNQFASRIDAAISKLDSSQSTAITNNLFFQQSLLLGRKERINDAIGVLNQALDQFFYLRNHVEYLREQIAAVEAGTITAAELSVDFDNKLRKINQLASAGSVLYKDAGKYFQNNLIESRSRSSFATQTLFAPYNSKGDLFQIDGVYLGTDYFITEDSSGDIFNSDVGFAASEDTVGTLTEYSSYPDTTTGVSDLVTSLTLNSYDASTNAVSFDLSDSTTITGIVTKGGLGILDSFLYDNFNSQAAIDRAKDDLDAAESLLLLTEADFRNDLYTLQSRASVFDVQIEGIDKEIASIVRDLQSEQEAELLALQLEFEVSRFQFALLAARGNILVFSLLLAGDAGEFGGSQATSYAVLGATIDVSI